MRETLTMGDRKWPRWLSFLCGAGMAVASVLTIDHFYAANYPTSIFKGSFCDINTFFNCDSSAYSGIADIGGVPLGFFGLLLGVLVMLGAVFPSVPFERTNKTLSLLNALGVIVLLLYSVIGLGSLCLLCSGFYFFSLASGSLFWRFGIDRRENLMASWFRPSIKHLTTYALVAIAGGFGLSLYTEARQDAQSGGVAARAAKEFYNLEVVEWPSIISPFWTAKATEDFEEAPIRIVEYADLLCSDCLYLHEQLKRLKTDFAGQMNIAFQFFPLEAKCNDVVEKDMHPGACDMSYAAAYEPDKFLEIHDEIFGNFQQARRQEEWRSALPGRFGVEAGLTDSATRELVDRLIQTGREYEKTDERFAHGIRSTPTMIVNNRMIIGTLPYEQLRAIFQALVDEHDAGDRRFIENWVD
jgi:uncharacterized membrane protein/protein-disulfide isomerase